MSGRKKIGALGIDRALSKVDIDYLAYKLDVAPSTIRRWRRDDPRNALQRAVEKAGNQVALANVLGVSQKTVSEWVRHDNPPRREKRPKNAVDEAVALAGDQPSLARALGVTQQNVSAWVRQGYVPAKRAQEIEVLYGVDRSRLLSPKIRSAVGLGGEL